MPPLSSASRQGNLRDRFAQFTALIAVVGLALTFFVSTGLQFLMPGPLSSAHSAIETCDACHTRSGNGKMSWVHGLVGGDPKADSKACLGCHKMPETAFNAHGAPGDVLEKSTIRLTKLVAATPALAPVRLHSLASSNHDLATRGLSCATCHQEHKGPHTSLTKISNEQCRSCHVMKFDSFDGDHPKFDSYPFRKRTPIVFDHAEHFGKHYPEVAKKSPAKSILETCSTCHSSRADKRIMAVASFDKTCATCHLDQITGKERLSGPKGIAFLSLPGLDLETLNRKKAAIGEWPDASEAPLTPFMKVMISRTDKGRDLVKGLEGINLQDLTQATDQQINAVVDLVWETKRLMHAMISGKASDALADLNIRKGAQLSAGLVADLTANLPRDVVVSAQQQWLPNLAREIASGPIVPDQAVQPRQLEATPSEAVSQAAPSPAPSDEAPIQSEDIANDDKPQGKPGDATTRDPPACVLRVLGSCLMFKDQQDKASAGDGASEPSEAERELKEKADRPSAGFLPEPMRAGLKEIRPPAVASIRTNVADTKASPKVVDQSDDLLFPTEEELRAMKGRDRAKSDEPSRGVAPTAGSIGGAVSQQAIPTPTITIDSGVDPESWADYGGWYRQDFAILYRPTGHKDRFIYSWLYLTGPQSTNGGASAAEAVFNSLTSKDAQGSCTKCHSVDDNAAKGKIINFSPVTVASKQGRFTRFVHEPHFTIGDDRGCLTCHSLEKGRPYLKSYEQGDPKVFTSNFASVRKDNCQTCHNRSQARQDCLLCHKYHVNGAETPMMQTKLPVQ